MVAPFQGFTRGSSLSLSVLKKCATSKLVLGLGKAFVHQCGETLIISASYKTDIPAFYGEWFLNRLAAGFCRMVNPYSRQVLYVSLHRDDVQGIVFWTRNLGPFLPHLDRVRAMGFPFVVQYTITGYPRELEYAVIPWEKSCEIAGLVSKSFGPRAVVWRYDPILLTTLTRVSFHVKQFEELAQRLEGITDEVVVSCAQMYRKTVANLANASATDGLGWWDPSDDEKRDLLAQLARIALRHGIQLTVCSQSAYAQVKGARPARCIDAARISDVAGIKIQAPKKGNRSDCECHQSRDIGDYDTCPHGCVYCYAVRNWDKARQSYLQHDPAGEFLVRPDGLSDEDILPAPAQRPLTLF